MNRVYRTYYKERFELGDIKPLSEEPNCLNKPQGGLWGCHGTEWYDWCQAEGFRCYPKYIEWELDKSAQVLVLNDLSDLDWVQDKYGADEKITDTWKIIDWIKVSKDYDAVEVTEYAAYDLHLASSHSNPLGYNAWDVPSICVWNMDKVKVLKETLL